MKKLYTTLTLLLMATMVMAQGFRVHDKGGWNFVDWNYNDFDSIVVDGGPDYYIKNALAPAQIAKIEPVLDRRDAAVAGL